MASTDIFEHFDELPDPRRDRRKRHSLMDILFISICAVICGATSFVDMFACRARTDHGAENFALLRQIAHNLIKQESSKKFSVRRKIKKAGWDNDFLLRIVVGV